jgi:D-aminopeptidase
VALGSLAASRGDASVADGQARPAGRARARDLGIVCGELPPGPLNAITDVPGVRVGHTTIVKGEGPLVEGKGPARTGVTAILPHSGNLAREAVPAAIYNHNGNGEVTGYLQVREAGWLASPIMLTGTFNVGRVYDFTLQYLLGRDADLGLSHPCPVPIVAETSDATLNDMLGRLIAYEDVVRAIDGAADGPVQEGAVGGGTGMVAYAFKAGIGTASRRLRPEQGGWTVGVLVQANHGGRGLLRIDGVPVGREITDLRPGAAPASKSIIIVVATDAPLLPNHLFRIAKRTSMGLARTGSISAHASGDIFLAFSTAARISPVDGAHLRPARAIADGFISSLYQPVVEATEEAIVNSITMADTMKGKNDYVVHAIPLDRLVDVMKRYGRLRTM